MLISQHDYLKMWQVTQTTKAGSTAPVDQKNIISGVQTISNGLAHDAIPFQVTEIGNIDTKLCFSVSVAW